MSKKLLIFTLLLVACTNFLFTSFVLAQIAPPNRREVFLEDENKRQKAKDKKKVNSSVKAKRNNEIKSKNLPFDIDARNINYDQNKDMLVAEGGVTITSTSAVLEADKANVYNQTNEAELLGNVRVKDITGNLIADYAKLNLNTKQGFLENAKLDFDEDLYRVNAKRIEKVGQVADTFLLEDSEISTCNCPDDADCYPWRIDASSGTFQKNGYGSVWGATLKVHGVPVFYTPYLFFPTKTTRQSGLLPATIGNGSRDGFQYYQPLFLAIDDATDATITSVLATRSRVGADVEFRKVFSLKNKLEMGGTFLNESARDGALRGTNITDIFDKHLDTNRFMGYYHQNISKDISGQNFQFLIDANYISDNLLLREFNKEQIGDRSSRGIFSKALARTNVLDTYTAEISADYQRSLVNDQNLVFQRSPEFDLAGSHYFKPFGDSIYGLKLGLTNELNITNFARDRYYDGMRGEIIERAEIPFHYYNYFDITAGADFRGSLYSLDNTTIPPSSDPSQPIRKLNQDTDRAVPGFDMKISNVLENVYELGEGNWIKYLGELGSYGRNEQMLRVKHTLEPYLKYRYVPEVDQLENPQFDAFDRLEEKNTISYGLVQRLLTRYEPRSQYLYGVEEATPEVKDLPMLGSNRPLDEAATFGANQNGSSEFRQIRRGSIREFLTFKLGQSFDLQQIERFNNNPNIDERLSDVDLDLLLLPNDQFKIRGRTLYDAETQNFDAYYIDSQMISKRGDELRTRLSFVKDQLETTQDVRQLEASLQLLATQRTKLGYYAIYDDVKKDIIEQRVGVRISSSCNCWVFDVTFADQLNPKQQSVFFNVNLIGVGEFGNGFFSKFLREDT